MGQNQLKKNFWKADNSSPSEKASQSESLMMMSEHCITISMTSEVHFGEICICPQLSLQHIISNVYKYTSKFTNILSNVPICGNVECRRGYTGILATSVGRQIY